MELQIFNNNEFGQIRSLMLDDEVWFIGKDITLALGYSNDRKALQDNVDADDRRLIQKSLCGTLEIPNRGITAINESGLYSLVLRSKLPNAKKFKKWVTSEVLPSIRKNGSYQKLNITYVRYVEQNIMIKLKHSIVKRDIVSHWK